jgi:hypothetical protein
MVKNVKDLSKCPDQIFLGADDPLYCTHIHVAAYQESNLTFYPNAEYLFTEKTGKHTQEGKVAWSKSQFKDVVAERDNEEGGVAMEVRSRHL